MGIFKRRETTTTPSAVDVALGPEIEQLNCERRWLDEAQDVARQIKPEIDKHFRALIKGEYYSTKRIRRRLRYDQSIDVFSSAGHVTVRVWGFPYLCDELVQLYPDYLVQSWGNMCNDHSRDIRISARG